MASPFDAVSLRAYTAQDFIAKALRLLNVIDALQQPPPEQLMQGFDVLQEMIDDWKTQRQLVLIVTPRQHVLTSGQQAYTIGPGGQFNQPRPIRLERWSAIPDRGANPVVRIPHTETLSLAQWQSIPVKSTAGSLPHAIYYDQAWDANGRGTVYVYPVPNVSTADIELWSPTPLQGFASLTTPYVFPPGFTRLIIYGLTVELAPYYPGALTERVERAASQAMANVKRANFRPRYASVDPMFVGGRRGRYDAYTDT